MPHSWPATTSRASSLKRLSWESLPSCTTTLSRMRRTLAPRSTTPSATRQPATLPTLETLKISRMVALPSIVSRTVGASRPDIIYNLVDDVKKAMSGLLAPTVRETMLGNATILEIFKVSKVGNVAGCRVTDGVVERGASVRLIRDSVVVHEGKLSQLKRFKDDAREVVAGQECGMAFENYQDMKVGDIIECYRVETVQRTL